MTVCCSQDVHDALKRDPETFAAETTHLGYVGDEEELIELRLCRACSSTLAAAPHTAEDQHRRDIARRLALLQIIREQLCPECAGPLTPRHVCTSATARRDR